MIGMVRTMSTLQASVQNRRQVADLDQQLQNAGQEAATGLKADVYRSLGLRSGEALALRARMERNDGFVTSNTMLSDRLAMTAQSMKEIRATAQSVLDLAVNSTGDRSGTADRLRSLARGAMDQLLGQLNRSYNGVPLFSGTDSAQSPMQDFDTVNPTTGRSPRDVLASAIGAGPANAADAAARIADLEGIFSSDPSVAADRRFEGTFFNGTPLKDGAGVPQPRLVARIDEHTALEHGVQANDPAVTEMLRGLAMFSEIDVSQIGDDAAFKAWTEAAASAIGQGISGMISTESRIGSQQKQLDEILESQLSRRDVYNSQVMALEGVDPYEAATRVNRLQTQLEASYAITARLSKLSFLNFL